MKRFVTPNFDFDRLKTALTNSKIASKNNALYQTIYQLIDKVKDVHNNSQTQIDEIISSSSGGGGGSGTGDVIGPASSTDNDLAAFDGTTGKLIKDSGILVTGSGSISGTNTGDVTLAGVPNYLTIAGQVITRALINLASHVTGRLPFANLVAATVPSILLGRRSGSAGDFEEITLGTNLLMSGTTLNATDTDTDYVLMSDGATPVPAPVDDGFGNFVYIAYTP